MNPIYCVIVAVCILSCVTMFFHMQNNSILSKTSKFWFTLVFWGVALGALIEFLGDWMNVTGGSPVLHLGIKVLEFCITPWMPVLMAFACGMEKKSRPVAILLMFHMVLELLLSGTGAIIVIDSQGLYHRGPEYYIYILFYAISFGYLLVLFYLLSRRFRNRDRITLIFSLVTLLAALVPSLISSKYRTAFLGITMTAIILYNYYEGLTEQELSEDLSRRNEKIRKMQERTIVGVADLIESRDLNTGTHIKNTSSYVEQLARSAQAEGVYQGQITDHFIELVIRAAPLHDIGKIVVPDAILRKPGRLTPEEFEVMKTHAEEGGKIIRQILDGIMDEEYTQLAFDVATYHHEKWNGQGYPAGLQGESIPLSARIMAIADVYDALTMERVYKNAFPVEKALAIIEEESGSHFDPELVTVFVRMIRETI